MATFRKRTIMNLEEARDFALVLPFATEDEFAEGWISYRIDGKWFMLIQLDAPEPRITLKFTPDENEELREHHSEIQEGYHMNHRHWSCINLNGALGDRFVEMLIRRSYALVASKLPKSSVHYSDIIEFAKDEIKLPLLE